jgi:hypothetical protein
MLSELEVAMARSVPCTGVLGTLFQDMRGEGALAPVLNAVVVVTWSRCMLQYPCAAGQYSTAPNQRSCIQCRYSQEALSESAVSTAMLGDMITFELHQCCVLPLDPDCRFTAPHTIPPYLTPPSPTAASYASCTHPCLHYTHSVGQYASGTGRTGCTACPAGTTTTGTGASACTRQELEIADGV